MQGVGNINTFRFANPSHGWLSFEQGGSMGRDQAAIYQTSDGGTTWRTTSVTTNIKGGALPLIGIKTGVTFSNGNNGWLTGYTFAHGSLYLYRRLDGRGIWKKQQLPLPSQIQDAQLASYPPVFFNQVDGILPVEAFGGPLIIYRTNDELFDTKDGGQTWARAKTNIKNVQELDFTSNDDGFALITAGAVYHTSDGGATWKQAN